MGCQGISGQGISLSAVSKKILWQLSISHRTYANAIWEESGRFGCCERNRENRGRRGTGTSANRCRRGTGTSANRCRRGTGTSANRCRRGTGTSANRCRRGTGTSANRCRRGTGTSANRCVSPISHIPHTDITDGQGISLQRSAVIKIVIRVIRG